MSVSFFHHRRMLVGSAVFGIIVLSTTLAGWGPLALARRLIVWAVEYPLLQERSATERDLPQFAHLAASQVGDGTERCEGLHITDAVRVIHNRRRGRSVHRVARCRSRSPRRNRPAWFPQERLGR